MNLPEEPYDSGLYVTKDLHWLLARSSTGRWSRCGLHGTANSKTQWSYGVWDTDDWKTVAETLGEDCFPIMPLGQWFDYELPKNVPDRGPLGADALEYTIDLHYTGGLGSVDYVDSIRNNY